MKNNNAIVGLAFNANEKTIAPFLHSLNHSGFPGELILFVNNEDINLGSHPYNFSVTFVNIERKYRSLIRLQKIIKILNKLKLGFLHRLWGKYIISKAKKKLERLRPFSPLISSYFYTDSHLTISRFIFYYNYLLVNQYRNIFFTDVNDVIFQGNPFRHADKNVLNVFLEDPSLTIGTEQYNKNWIIQGYGEQGLSQMYNKRVHCAGTILTDYDTSILFLKDLIKEICNYNIPRNLAGMDQGVFNYMISVKKINYFKINDNGHIVFTVGAVSTKSISIKENKVYSSTSPGLLPAVIHQYNRHPFLIDLFEKVYCR